MNKREPSIPPRSDRRNGKRRVSPARPEHPKASLEEFWYERLAALKRAAERKEGTLPANDD